MTVWLDHRKNTKIWGEIKTQRIFSMRFYLLLKFLQNLYRKRHSIGISWFHRVHSFDSKGFIGKIPIRIKSSKISIYFIWIKGALDRKDERNGRVTRSVTSLSPVSVPVRTKICTMHICYLSSTARHIEFRFNPATGCVHVHLLIGHMYICTPGVGAN